MSSSRKQAFPTSLIALGAIGLLATATIEVARPRGISEGLDRPNVRFHPDALTITAQGDDRRRSFILSLHNATKVPVKILGAQVSCGCTVLQDLQSVPIAPGQTKSVNVAVTIPHYGEKHVRIVVRTDSKHAPHVSADVLLKGADRPVPYLTATNDRVELSGIRPGAVSHDLIVTTLERKGAPPWIQSATTNAEWLVVSRPLASDGEIADGHAVQRSYTVSIQGEIGVNEAIRNGLIQLIASDGTPVGSVSVTCRLIPAVIARPVSLYTSVTGHDAPQDLTVVLNPIDAPEPLQVRLPAEMPAWLHVNPGKTGNSGVLAVKVSFDRTAFPPDAGDFLRTEMRLETNHPDCRTVAIPIVVRLR